MIQYIIFKSSSKCNPKFMSSKIYEKCELVEIISKAFINFVHFIWSIISGYHSIPKINWGSFQGRRKEIGIISGGCTVAWKTAGITVPVFGTVVNELMEPQTKMYRFPELSKKKYSS